MTPFYSKKATRSRRQNGTSRKVGLSYETLEDRALLAAVTVGTAADLVDGNTTTVASLIADPGADGAVSLREALTAANNSSDFDTITFDTSVFNGDAVDVIRLQSPLSVDQSVEIIGGDQGVVVSGDSLGDDTLVAGSFVTDTVASDIVGLLSDNTDRVFQFFGGSGQTSTISGLTITGGASSGGGGGILAAGSNLTLDQSTVAGNRASDFGGGIASSGGDFVITNSTISGNATVGETAQGGGVFSVSGSLTVSSSTVSGNVATSSIGVSAGGGIFVDSHSSLINDSTITENIANFGGGITVDSPFSAVTLEVENSIVANNTALSASADIATGFSVTVDASFSLIGDRSGTSLAPTSGLANAAGNLIGTQTTPIDPGLASLADNGGLTKTHRLLPTSPAINAGSSFLALDQRGMRRVFGGNADIGAFESQQAFLIVDTSDGFADGDFSNGNFSLAEAIEISNSTSDVETIVFDSSVFNGEATDVIHLNQELDITRSVTIDGGDLDVVISGDRFRDDTVIPGTFITDINNFRNSDNVRVFDVGGNFGDIVTLRGLTITGGSANSEGGGIRSSSATLVIEASVVSGNLADFGGNGGGIAIVDGSLIVLDSVVSQNRAGESGGGIFADAGVVTVVNSEISDNFTQGSGGGIFADDANVIVDRSTISGNEASTDDGGGIETDDGSITVSNSTISGNLAGDDGAAIFTSEGDVTITDSTLTLNRASGDGSIAIAPFFSAGQPLLTIKNSIVADNRVDINLGPNVAPVDISSSLIGNAGNVLDAAPIGSPDADGNLVGTNTNPIDPLLGELADNGGPTKTHELLIGSPAIDAGQTTTIIDQRGELRPNAGGNGPDIGAFEEQTLTLRVDTSDDLLDGDFSAGNQSLREAIDRANANPGVDRIFFDAQVFDGDASDVIRLVNGELEITEGVVIDAGDLRVVVSGDSFENDVLVPESFIVDIVASESLGSLTDNSRVFNITTDLDEIVSISGLTVTGGNASDGGGGIAISSAIVDLTDVNVSGNQSSGSGGGILTDNQLTIDDGIVSGNIAANDGTGGVIAAGGGIAAGAGVVTVINSTISDNQGTNRGGGGIYTTFGDVLITGSTVSGNQISSGFGGAIFSDNGAVTVTDSSVVNNLGGLGGGGISTSSGDIAVIDSSVDDNQGGNGGGGINSDSGSVSVSQSTISGNIAAGIFSNGGGIATRTGNISVAESTITENQGSGTFAAGGIRSTTGSITVSDSTVSGNSTPGRGGGIRTQSGTVSVTRSAINNNESGADGGGIFVINGLSTVSESTVSGNSAAGDGGGIYNIQGELVLNNSTVSDNSSAADGGGIVTGTSVATITNSTLSGNSAGGFGGAIYVGFAELLVFSSTIAFNESSLVDGGGGIFNAISIPGADTRSPSNDSQLDCCPQHCRRRRVGSQFCPE